MASHALNPNAQPFYYSVSRTTPFSHHHIYHPFAYAASGFGFYDPSKGRVWRSVPLMSGFAKPTTMKGNMKKKRLEWRRVRDPDHDNKENDKVQKKLLEGNGGSARRRAPIPFPATLEEAKAKGITTVMVRNIPNQLTLQEFLGILDDHCVKVNKGVEPADWSKYDFVYLPMDYWKDAYEGRSSNLGYAFVNFTRPNAAFLFYKLFNGLTWNVTSNNKICDINVAQYQGKESLKQKFDCKRFVCLSPHFRPLEFSGARDGSNPKQSLSNFVGIYVHGFPRRKAHE
ncbi:hypothetical protein PIB30_098891 [Stylosanthes scabra]|uniref:Mei2-like C-terminal RNA recognition motif domain-containing protein n=1 Tax=Stylosanthes scabra TaxID=79078 RepID=A0ABU6VYF4_9FABA|nr:hypothetical protein [Stylosanthes scabra]